MPSSLMNSIRSFALGATRQTCALLVASTSLLGLSACGPSSPIGSFHTPGDISIANEQMSQNLSSSVTVVDSNGRPITNAVVLIGPRENVPFPGNLLTTDANGQFAIPADWNSAQPLTIAAPGYLTTTYFGQEPQPGTYSVKRAAPAQRLEVKGKTTGFGPLPRDGYLDIGMVFPAVPRSQASTLNLSSLISPEMDIITIMGQSIAIPSNVTIPRQKESYIIPITLDKPIYRLYLPEVGLYQIVAAHARFPFREVVDALRSGQSFMGLINKFEFRETSVHDVPVTRNPTSIDLGVNQIPLQPTYRVSAPRFDGQLAMVTASLAARNNLYYVTDVRRLMPEESATLKAPTHTANPGLLVSVLRRDNDELIGRAAEELSAVTLPTNQSQALEFLPLIPIPELRGRTLLITPPSPRSGIAPVVTYATLSKVEILERDGFMVENKTPQWEVYAKDWISEFELPELPVSTPDISGNMRWQVIYGGQAPTSEPVKAGPGALEKVSHVTRNAVDF